MNMRELRDPLAFSCSSFTDEVVSLAVALLPLLGLPCFASREVGRVRLATSHIHFRAMSGNHSTV